MRLALTVVVDDTEEAVEAALENFETAAKDGEEITVKTSYGETRVLLENVTELGLPRGRQRKVV